MAETPQPSIEPAAFAEQIVPSESPLEQQGFVARAWLEAMARYHGILTFANGSYQFVTIPDAIGNQLGETDQQAVPFELSTADTITLPNGTTHAYEPSLLHQYLSSQSRVRIRMERTRPNGQPLIFIGEATPMNQETALVHFEDVTEAEQTRAENQTMSGELQSVQNSLEGRVFEADAERIIDIALSHQLENPGSDTALHDFFIEVVLELKKLLITRGVTAEVTLYSIPSDLYENVSLDSQLYVQKATFENDQVPNLPDETILSALNITRSDFSAVRGVIADEDTPEVFATSSLRDNDQSGDRFLLAFFSKAGELPSHLAERIPYIMKRFRIDTAKLEQIIRSNKEATVDKLTGLATRRAFIAEASRMISESLRYGTAIGLAYVDIDRFKMVNDMFGHGAGDTVLSKVAQALQRRIRTTDVIGRHGGEELLTIFPELSLNDLYTAGDGLRNSFEQVDYPLRGTHNGEPVERLSYTGSVGVVPIEQIIAVVNAHEETFIRFIADSGKLMPVEKSYNADIEFTNGTTSREKNLNQLKTAVILELAAALGSFAMEEAKTAGRNRTFMVDYHNGVWQVFRNPTDRQTLRSFEENLARLPADSDPQTRANLEAIIAEQHNRLVVAEREMFNLKLGEMKVFGDMTFLHEYLARNKPPEKQTQTD